MPYSRVGPNDYVSPNGNHINSAQLKLWHANGEKWPGQKQSEGKMAYAKGGDIRPASYAAGGPVLGRTREFIKTTNEARDPDEGPAGYQQYAPGRKTTIVGDTADEDQKYGKDGAGKGKGMVPNSAPSRRSGDKSLKAVKPRS